MHLENVQDCILKSNIELTEMQSILLNSEAIQSVKINAQIRSVNRLERTATEMKKYLEGIGQILLFILCTLVVLTIVQILSYFK